MSTHRSTATVVVALVIGAVVGGAVISLVRKAPQASVASDAPEGHEELPAGVVEISDSAQRNAALQTVSVTKQTLPASIDVTGVVAPDESRVGHIRPLARGVVERIAVTLGARVTQGQTLVAYDNIELGELVGSYLGEIAAQRQAEADREVRQRALERAEELIKIDAIARQTLELRRAEFRNAEAAVESRRAGVAKVEEQIHRFGLSDADIQGLRPEQGTSGHRTASHSVLRAPFAGVVTKFDVAQGELVGPERELMTISDMSTVWVMADVYEKDLAKVRANTDVAIHVDAYPGRRFVGRLTYVSDIIDPQTRTAKVRCVVQNADGALKLDMFAKVSIATTDRQDAVVVPVAAVQRIDGQSVVFVRQNAQRFIRRDVEVGATAGESVAITSGLSGGETIATAGSFYLKTAALRERIGDEH